MLGCLEGPILTEGPGQVTSYPKVIEPPQRPAAARALGEAGIRLVALANNHMMNFGPEGVVATLDALRASDVAYCGAGRDVDEARRPFTFRADRIRLAVLDLSCIYEPGAAARKDRPGISTFAVTTAYEPGPRAAELPGSPPIVRTWPVEAELARLCTEIAAASAAADFVVVAFHWGVTELRGDLAEYQIALAHAVIEAGAGLVVGSHVHRMQAVEVHRGRPILYGLGNFAFDLANAWFAKDSVVASLTIGPSGAADVSLVPVAINDRLEPEPLPRSSWSGWLEELDSRSERFGTRFEIGDDSIVVAAEPRSG